MRRGFGWGAAILLVLLLVGVGIGAYNWGVTEGLERTGEGVEVVRYVGGHGFGFFPFFPILFIILVFGLFRPWRWGGGPGRGSNGGGGWGPSHAMMEERMNEWHKQAHNEGDANRPGS